MSAAGRLNVDTSSRSRACLCVFLAWIVAAWFERIAHKYSPRSSRWGPVAIATVCLFIFTEDTIFALHTAGMPKSGIRTFVASRPLEPATLYVVVPDYMTATFVFYVRDPRVAYTAFPQTDHPEVFRVWDRWEPLQPPSLYERHRQAGEQGPRVSTARPDRGRRLRRGSDVGRAFSTVRPRGGSWIRWRRATLSSRKRAIPVAWRR